MLFEASRYDLLRATKELGTNHKFKAISQKIRDYSALESAKYDLFRAKKLFGLAAQADLARDRPAKDPAMQEEVTSEITGALIFRAIMIYTSATHSVPSNTSGRKPTTPKKMPKEIEQAHERLWRLRNSALAHYGSGDEFAPSPWMKDALVVDISTDPLRLDAKGSRSCYTTQANHDLSECLDFMSQQISCRVEERRKPLIQEIEELIKDNEFANIMKKYEFTKDNAFKGEEPNGSNTVRTVGKFVDGHPMKNIVDKLFHF